MPRLCLASNGQPGYAPPVTMLLIATRNRHKAGEIRAVLGEGFRCLTLAELPGAPDVLEDAQTFAGNATKKALALARWLADQPAAPAQTARWVVADDSGLEVDALEGAPGVHSARFALNDPTAPGNSTDHDNNTKLLACLTGIPAERRTARFRCVLALAPVCGQPSEAGGRPPGPPAANAPDTGEERPPSEVEVRLFEGACEGHILHAGRGQGGFGYDPLFQPLGHSTSFAELGEAVKNQISHRARALAKLRDWLRANAPPPRANDALAR